MMTPGPLHFVGIGGIGMSGIAEILAQLGYVVQGSDIVSSSPLIEKLREQGIRIFPRHHPDNIAGASVVIASSAVQSDNIEIATARARAIPVIGRAEMLAELMRFGNSIAVGGTHGKTTTTSLVATMLHAAGHDPTVVNGGIINIWDSNARLGKGEWMVVEADESDGSFVRLPAIVSVVTNIDAEHMDYYANFEALRCAFRCFAENIPFYGFIVLGTDHPELRRLAASIRDRRVLGYGLGRHNLVRARDLVFSERGTQFRLLWRGKGDLGEFFLPMPGAYNVQNALAALAIGAELGIDVGRMRRALAEFQGVGRRFTRVGSADGIVVFDDYGHHPAEIRAVLNSAKTVSSKRVIAVLQPHRLTRVRSLFAEFCTCVDEADIVFVSEIYAAGEPALEGVSARLLTEGMRQHGHNCVHYLPDPEQLASRISALARSGDWVVCLGAGSITRWARALPEQLARLRGVAQKA